MMINRKKTSEPKDNSDEFAKIGVEMQRLGWTIEDGRNYLYQTYCEKSRHLLSPEELLEFLHYLQSQPIPANDNAIAKRGQSPIVQKPQSNFIVQFDDEIEKEQEYLFQTYGKESLKLRTRYLEQINSNFANFAKNPQHTPKYPHIKVMKMLPLFLLLSKA